MSDITILVAPLTLLPLFPTFSLNLLPLPSWVMYFLNDLLLNFP